jgi:transposase
LLWDKSRPHQADTIRDFLHRHRRIHAHFFPGYAPELNPDEFVWTQIKRTVANSVPKDLAHLKGLLQPPIRRLRRSQRLLWSCIRASELPW